jgi:hypothetical protein
VDAFGNVHARMLWAEQAIDQISQPVGPMELPDNVKLIRDYDPSLPELPHDPDQIEQVLLNTPVQFDPGRGGAPAGWGRNHGSTSRCPATPSRPVYRKHPQGRRTGSETGLDGVAGQREVDP